MIVTLAAIIAVAMIGSVLAFYRDRAASVNRDSLKNDLVHLASQAWKYYRRPAMLMGGNGSYGQTSMTELTSRPGSRWCAVVQDPC